MTINDIANMAGVSKATVSRVLNDSGYVNSETRKKIEAIIERTQYSPSMAAVNLSKQTSKSIGVIVPEIYNTFFAELMAGISEVAQIHDYVLTYCNTNNDFELEEKAINLVEKQQVCALIITPAIGFFKKSTEDKLLNMYEKSHIPIVVVDRGFETCQWDGVFYENFQSTYIATNELIKAGNKSIGIITGDMKLLIAQERFEGYMAAMKDSGLPIENSFILKGDFTLETSYLLTKKMFAVNKKPDGMVMCNNYTSLGFLKACNEEHIKIGKDISVIGIDHIPALDAIGYPLSVVTRDAIQMGRHAMDMLIYRLENPSEQNKITMIPCDVYLRGSEKITIK